MVGRPHEIKGQAIAAFVTVKEGVALSDALAEELKQHVVQKIGAIARPDDVIFAADLPKTRSGKIMRRLLRDIAEGKALGDTTTLADPAVVQKLKDQYEEEQLRRGAGRRVRRIHEGAKCTTSEAGRLGTFETDSRASGRDSRRVRNPCLRAHRTS